MNASFIEITFHGKVIGLININQIVSILEVDDAGVTLTLTDGKNVHTDMKYSDLKLLLNIKTKPSSNSGVTYS